MTEMLMHFLRILEELNCFSARQQSLAKDGVTYRKSLSSKLTVSAVTSSLKPSTSVQPDTHCDHETTADTKFWWEATTVTLRSLLIQAKYSAGDQNALLDFHYKYIVGSLGPRPFHPGVPAKWRSFMTDDFSPLEWSWNWGSVGKSTNPTIRYSVEPISCEAGLRGDLWNMNATFCLVERFEKDLVGFDSSLFHELAPRLVKMCSQVSLSQLKASNEESPSSMFLAFDLDNASPTVKAYFVPFNTLSKAVKQKSRQLIKDLLLPFAQENNWQSLLSLLEFGENSDELYGIEPFMVAWDCVPLQENRVKIYFRSADTSFATVLKVLRAHDAQIFEGNGTLENLQSLWEGIFAQDPRQDPARPLAGKEHSTAGILYYFDVRPGSPKISPKVYLPAKHYGINDLHTMKALCSYFNRKSRGRTNWTAEYELAVKAMCSHRQLEQGQGLHTYISCAVKGDALNVTSYFNPEIYHSNRRAIMTSSHS